MPLGQRSELWKLEEDPGPVQGLVESEQGSSSSDEEGSSTCDEPQEPQPGLQNIIQGKLADLVEFLLLKYHTKEPTSQAEMLEILGKDDQDAFPVILGQVSECMQLVFGMDVKEVDPNDHSYILVPVLGLTYDGMLSGEQGVPQTGLLVLVLGVILLHGDRAPEEEVWETLGIIGVYAGQEHGIYGEPRELLTNVWVQEGYVEYRQVPGSDPARYEFLWGPRAHAETGWEQVVNPCFRIRVSETRGALAEGAGPPSGGRRRGPRQYPESRWDAGGGFGLLPPHAPLGALREVRAMLGEVGVRSSEEAHLGDTQESLVLPRVNVGTPEGGVSGSQPTPRDKEGMAQKSVQPLPGSPGNAGRSLSG
ncbi:PREDICTED: melanoma-associated antigen 8-like [Odobenus rosmarus divergens]|uniref:Melanoma-associated antigen 8-like n=1 Tax=Odobenus rosmarus divergens TaxID=9708 RepID=A0A9B0HFJ7_ODORO